MHEVAAHAVPRGPPAGGSQQVTAHGLTRLRVVGEGLDERPDESHDDQGVVEVGAGVGDPDLDRRVVRRQTGVEVEHAGVERGSAADQGAG